MTENGQVALVTGAARGIGNEVARQLAAQSYTVLVGARGAGKARRPQRRSTVTRGRSSST